MVAGANVITTIEELLRAALADLVAPARVVFDTTRGLGLYRMLAQSAVQKVCEADGHELAAAYADPDQVQVVVVPVRPAGPVRELATH
ncbi:MAG: hypothetical protein FJ100_18250 [Deltaproteobacteria bacterium]|nr:hypothetical protein [Deltaproteobacteria bacterium]